MVYDATVAGQPVTTANIVGRGTVRIEDLVAGGGQVNLPAHLFDLLTEINLKAGSYTCAIYLVSVFAAVACLRGKTF